MALFRWPVVAEIWNQYLLKFIERYVQSDQNTCLLELIFLLQGQTKIERTRELFEQCLEKCQPKFAKAIYLLYATFEEVCCFIDGCETNVNDS